MSTAVRVLAWAFRDTMVKQLGQDGFRDVMSKFEGRVQGSVIETLYLLSQHPVSNPIHKAGIIWLDDHGYGDLKYFEIWKLAA